MKCKINCSICSTCWPVSTCITLTEYSCILPIKQCGSQEEEESIEQNVEHVLENIVKECEGHGVDNRSLVYPSRTFLLGSNINQKSTGYFPNIRPNYFLR